MRAYYCNTYQHPVDAAIENSQEFKEKRDIRYKIEKEIIDILGGTGTKEYKVFDEYIGAVSDEHYVIEEEMYLMGAADREKMLR